MMRATTILIMIPNAIVGGAAKAALDDVGKMLKDLRKSGRSEKSLLLM
jgi:hypothetical protein